MAASLTLTPADAKPARLISTLGWRNEELDRQMRLLAVLASTKVLLSHSDREGWGFEEPDETAAKIDQFISALFYGSPAGLPDGWQVLFAPTGPLQEIALANGWSEVYLRLSESFDRLEHILEEHEKGSLTMPSTPTK
jgi:hypothetical protein